MNPIRKRLAIALLLVTVYAACKSVAPGQDPILVRAQQSYATTLATCDFLFTLQANNKDSIEKALPGTNAIVNEMRAKAKLVLPELLKAIDSYAATKDSGPLMKWSAVAAQLLDSAQKILTSLSASHLAVAPVPRIDLRLYPVLI